MLSKVITVSLSEFFKCCFWIISLQLLLLSTPDASSQDRYPKLELSKFYKSQPVNEFLVSEKYDGLRAIWKDGVLTTKSGNQISAPNWFTKNFPEHWLDGELWIKRNSFEQVSSVVLKHFPIDEEWQNVKYMVFDMLGIAGSFEQRYKFYSDFLSSLNIPYIQPIKHYSLSSRAELFQQLTLHVEQGAEGLMLHRKSAVFEEGRTGNILKLKMYMDDEAKVIGFVKGKGLNTGLMGSLKLEYANSNNQKVYFNLGTGFSKQQRKEPPPIGSIITFKYYGLTNNGIPKFASFLRVRDEQ